MFVKGKNEIPDEIEPLLLLIWVKQSVTRCTEICLDCRCVRCNFLWSFVQDRLIVSNDSCNTFFWNASEENNNITHWLTHVLCFNQINFTYRVGMPLVMNVKNQVANFSDQILPFFAEDARLRSDMLVCLLSCLSLLLSDNSTEFCQCTLGNLNDKLHSSIHAVFRSCF